MLGFCDSTPPPTKKFPARKKQHPCACWALPGAWVHWRTNRCCNPHRTHTTHTHFAILPCPKAKGISLRVPPGFCPGPFGQHTGTGRTGKCRRDKVPLWLHRSAPARGSTHGSWAPPNLFVQCLSPPGSVLPSATQALCSHPTQPSLAGRCQAHSQVAAECPRLPVFTRQRHLQILVFRMPSPALTSSPTGSSSLGQIAPAER